MKLDYQLISDVVVDHIDPKDAPDYADAFIASATYAGREMTDDEMEVLNVDSAYVNQKTIEQVWGLYA